MLICLHQSLKKNGQQNNESSASKSQIVSQEGEYDSLPTFTLKKNIDNKKNK